MSTAGPNSPGTMADSDAVGTAAWYQPDRAKANDGSYTSATVMDPFTSHYLKATNFGFTIPTGATINGITVEIEEQDPADSNTINDSVVRIIKADGALGTENKAKATKWTSATTYITYGANNDLWGESWDYSAINDTDFGVVLSATDAGMFGQMFVDHIQITITYTAGASTSVPVIMHQYRQRRS
jgi:hypothetical protein